MCESEGRRTTWTIPISTNFVLFYIPHYGYPKLNYDEPSTIKKYN